MLLAIASPAAYLIGVERTPGTGSGMMAAAAVLLILVASVHSYGRRALYRRAAALSGDPEALSAAGEAEVRANGGRISVPARAAFEETLKGDPRNPRAFKCDYLAGIGAEVGCPPADTSFHGSEIRNSMRFRAT